MKKEYNKNIGVADYTWKDKDELNTEKQKLWAY